MTSRCALNCLQAPRRLWHRPCRSKQHTGLHNKDCQHLSSVAGWQGHQSYRDGAGYCPLMDILVSLLDPTAKVVQVNMFNARGIVNCIGLCPFLHLVTGKSTVAFMHVMRTDVVQFFCSSPACVYVCAAMPDRACRQCLATVVCQNGCLYEQRPWTLSRCCAVCRWQVNNVVNGNWWRSRMRELPSRWFFACL